MEEKKPRATGESIKIAYLDSSKEVGFTTENGISTISGGVKNKVSDTLNNNALFFSYTAEDNCEVLIKKEDVIIVMPKNIIPRDQMKTSEVYLELKLRLAGLVRGYVNKGEKNIQQIFESKTFIPVIVGEGEKSSVWIINKKYIERIKEIL